MLWLLLYEGFLKALGQPDRFLTNITAEAGNLLLNLFGYSTRVVSAGNEAILLQHGEPVLTIARNCNGLAVFSLFAGFVAIFPSNSFKKLLYIPAGILALFLLNVVRVVFLTMIYLYRPEWLDFNHTYTFTIIIYAAVFGLWMLWVNKFTGSTTQARKIAVF